MAKALEPFMTEREATVKATVQRELIEKAKQSNARATTPIHSVASTGKTRTARQQIESMTAEDFDRQIAAAAAGKRISIPDLID